MAGFLRKKATFSRKSSVRDTKLPSTVSSPEKLSFDTPPSLPPLIVNASLADPEPASLPPPSLPPAASPPVVALPTPATAYLTPLDDWNPWNAYSNAPSVPRLDSQTRANVTTRSHSVEKYAPQPLRDHTTPSIPNPRAPPLLPGAAVPQSIKLSASNADSDAATTYYTAVSRPSPVATEHIQRKQPARDVREERALPPTVPPKNEVLGNQPLTQKPKSVSANVHRPSNPPAVVRGQKPLSSNFDFEESLSAANVTSVVNQFRSHPPPTRNHVTPRPTLQDPETVIEQPQASNDQRQPGLQKKSGSSSSLSSSSHHTDVTRRTNGSYGTSTSASSIPPVTEVIDVSDAGGRLDPVCPSSTSHSGFNGSSPSGVGSPRSPSIGQSGPSPAARNFTTNTAPSRVQRPNTASSVPPTSYSERIRSLARQTSLSSLASAADSSESYSRTPMLFDALRSAGSELSGQFRKGPLIFNAMPPTPLSDCNGKPPTPSHMPAQNAYPSPPAEYASLEGSSPLPARSASVSSTFQRTSQADTHSPEPTLPRKTSKSSLSAARTATERSTTGSLRGDVGSETSKPRVLTKARPTTPQKPTTPSQKVLVEPGDSLLLDDDPFARIEGVRMLKPRARTPSNGEKELPNAPGESKEEDVARSEEEHRPKTPSTPPPAQPISPPTPVSPDDYKAARQQRRGQWLEKAPPPAVAEVIAKQRSMHDEGVQAGEHQADEEQPREPSPPPTYFPIVSFMSDANLLPLLLAYLTYPEWLALYSANKQIRELFQGRILREFVLERYLGTVGYSKWNFEWAEPLPLSLKDLNSYLRGVSMPTHEYARLAAAYLQPKAKNREDPSASDGPDILSLALTTRAYTRVVLRLRAQAESEARYARTLQSAEKNRTASPSRPSTRQPSVSSRAPSPTSSYSHSRNHSHGGKSEIQRIHSSSTSGKFRSPLFRPGRAPVLRVFVPSPDGDWLSDASVVECEAELKRSGILKLLRVGDVVWDVAVGDEGNLGRMIWDGSYLVDLDYRYSRVGEISQYFHSLAFSPSYFHRAIRIGGSATHNPHCNPIVHVDVSPWGREIATNLQLLQDRARTETPHGALHDVVRWVHRSTFTIRPPVPPPHAQAYSSPRALRVPIPNVEGFFIDPGWYGTVVVEAEGTNEGLSDLQERCGPGVFPPRATNVASKMRGEREKEGRRVWRILREKSRPGEIWLRAVETKERVM